MTKLLILIEPSGKPCNIVNALNIRDFKQLLSEYREVLGDNCSVCPAVITDMPEPLQEAMQVHVVAILKKYNDNISRAAKALGVTRNTVIKYREQMFRPNTYLTK